jgi:hypothetical protein
MRLGGGWEQYRSLSAAAASAAALESTPLVAAWEWVPGSASAGTAPRDTAQAGLAVRRPEAGQSRYRLTGLGTGLVRCGGFGPWPLLVQLRARRDHWRRRRRFTEVQSTRVSAILVYEAVEPCTEPQEEKAARASSGLAAVFPARRSPAGIGGRQQVFYPLFSDE